jgi:hypothetical protein
MRKKVVKNEMTLLKERKKTYLDFLKIPCISYHECISHVSNRIACANYALQDEFTEEVSKRDEENVKILLFEIKIYRNLEKKLVHKSAFFIKMKRLQLEKERYDYLSKTVLNKENLRRIIVDEDSIYVGKYKEELKEHFKKMFPDTSLIKYLIK